jgi:hypothetical protein
MAPLGNIMIIAREQGGGGERGGGGEAGGGEEADGGDNGGGDGGGCNDSMHAALPPLAATSASSSRGSRLLAPYVAYAARPWAALMTAGARPLSFVVQPPFSSSMSTSRSDTCSGNRHTYRADAMNTSVGPAGALAPGTSRFFMCRRLPAPPA